MEVSYALCRAAKFTSFFVSIYEKFKLSQRNLRRSVMNSLSKKYSFLIKYPREQAKNLLSKYRQQKIDNWELLKTIARENDITVDFWPFDKDIAGMYWQYGNKNIIAVNENHTRDEQTFTIAHHMGHHFLNHKPSLCLANLFDSPRKEEQEANIFAVELLMPEESIENICKEYLSVDLLEKLSETFQLPENIISYRIQMLDVEN